jgi:heme-degrading monooxygenase HmoA
MIKRIVVMEMFPEGEAVFMNIFNTARQHIRAMDGCLGLELLRSTYDNRIQLWTISIWQSEDALENYRSSPLFASTWSAVKPLFATKARAWTLTPIDTLP